MKRCKGCVCVCVRACVRACAQYNEGAMLLTLQSIMITQPPTYFAKLAEVSLLSVRVWQALCMCVCLSLPPPLPPSLPPTPPTPLLTHTCLFCLILYGSNIPHLAVSVSHTIERQDIVCWSDADKDLIKLNPRCCMPKYSSE